MKNNIGNLLRLEFYTLCALALSLPLFEVAKHLFCLIYLGLFSYRTLKYKETFKYSPLGKFFIILIIASIISSIGAAYNGYDILKLHDIIRYSLIGWMILHTPLSQKQLYYICAMLIASSLIACCEAYYLLNIGQEKYFELRSVGHINHSSIYILLILGITLPLFLIRTHKKLFWLLFPLINCAGLYFLLETNSRATFIGLVLILLTLTLSLMLQYKKSTPFILIGCTLLISVIAINPPNVINKFIGKYKYYSGKITPREKSWNTTYHAWKKEKAFGVGFGNYRTITPEKMKEWYKNTNIDVTDKQHFIYLPHTHNRYMNTLAEGGVIGLSGLLILFGAILYLLLINIKHLTIKKGNIYFWLIGFNTLSTITIVGLFNTTLHHEHGLLAMILIGISFNYLYRNRPTTTLSPQGKTS